MLSSGSGSTLRAEILVAAVQISAALDAEIGATLDCLPPLRVCKFGLVNAPAHVWLHCLVQTLESCLEAVARAAAVANWGESNDSADACGRALISIAASLAQQLQTAPALAGWWLPPLQNVGETPWPTAAIADVRHVAEPGRCMAADLSSAMLQPACAVEKALAEAPAIVAASRETQAAELAAHRP